MERIIVFGSNGFLGKTLQKYLNYNGLDQKYAFTGVDVNNIDPLANFNLMSSDLTNKIELEDILMLQTLF